MDITMCNDSKCAARHGCLRFIGRRSDLQSYFASTPREAGADSCEYFWETTVQEQEAFKAREKVRA